MRTASFLLAALVLASLLPSSPAHAQRRIIGGEAPPPEEKAEGAEKKDDKKKDDKPAESAADKKRKAEEAKKKREEEERLRAEKEAAEEARKEAAEEARLEAERKAEEDKKRRAEEEAQRKIEEARAKEEARLQALRDGRLKTAKVRRRLTREDGKLRGSIALEPGGPTTGKVAEVRIDVAERLKVADPRFGELKPLAGLRLIATVREPATGPGGATEHRYVIHPLRTPGSYGFHHTPRMDGEHTLRIDGKTAKGAAFSFEVPLHVGVWPPPDFDDEEKNNARFEVTTGGRRAIGAR